MVPNRYKTDTKIEMKKSGRLNIYLLQSWICFSIFIQVGSRIYATPGFTFYEDNFAVPDS